MAKPHVVLLYHYFHPDDVISARLYSQLACHLVKHGFDVTALPANRSCHDSQQKYSRNENWNGVSIRRIWRPSWAQASNKGRIGNALCLLLGWTLCSMLLTRQKNETVIIGTDPMLGAMASMPWRLFRPRSRIIHWCHDLYPHAAVADGVLKKSSWLVRLLNSILRFAYRRCDVVVDLGPCMRKLLVEASGFAETTNELRSARTRFNTVTPWALVEPRVVQTADFQVKEELFGSVALGLLYSGNLGRAHEFNDFLELARALRTDSIGFCFSGRGARMAELKEELTTDDTNVSLAAFASEVELEKRLGAADIHLVSLNSHWTGCVVPSKFFGALAIGRPILFLGDASAALAVWIEQLKVGWVLNGRNVAEVAEELRKYRDSTERRQTMNAHCHQVYTHHFASWRQLDALTGLCKRDSQ